jgi:hypothetical protein
MLISQSQGMVEATVSAKKTIKMAAQMDWSEELCSFFVRHGFVRPVTIVSSSSPQTTRCPK